MELKIKQADPALPPPALYVLTLDEIEMKALLSIADWQGDVAKCIQSLYENRVAGFITDNVRQGAIEKFLSSVWSYAIKYGLTSTLRVK